MTDAAWVFAWLELPNEGWTCTVPGARLDVYKQPNDRWIGVMRLEEVYFPGVCTGCLTNIPNAKEARALMEAGYQNILASFDVEEARKLADPTSALLRKLAGDVDSLIDNAPRRRKDS